MSKKYDVTFTRRGVSKKVRVYAQIPQNALARAVKVQYGASCYAGDPLIPYPHNHLLRTCQIFRKDVDKPVRVMTGPVQIQVEVVR